MKRGVGRLPAVPMTARYATTCRVCSGPVQPGDEITKADQGWAHGPCAATTSDTPQKAAPQRPTAEGRTDPRAAGDARRRRRARGVDGRRVLGQPRARRLGVGHARRAPAAAAARPPPPTNGWRSRRRWRRCGPCRGPLTVVSDSTYVVNCFRDGWWRGWLARGWTDQRPQAGGQPRSVGAADHAGERARRRDLPVGEGPLRRRDERPGRPARRRGVRRGRRTRSRKTDEFAARAGSTPL